MSLNTQSILPKIDPDQLEKKIQNYKESGFLNIGFCCCVTKLIIATVFAISFSTTWYQKSTFSTQKYNQILLEYSPDWSSTVTILPENLQTESYLMSKKPDLVRLSLPVFENYNLFPGQNYTFVSYQLMNGSEIFLKYSTASNSSLGFYIIEGKYPFSYYTTRFYYEGPLNGNIYDRYIRYSNSPYGAVSYKFDTDGRIVYFIWESKNNQIVSANFSLALNIYDTNSDCLKSCNGVCDFKLTYGSNQIVLINPVDFLKNISSSSLTVTREFRFSTWFSLGLGLTGPFALITIAIFLNYLLLKFCNFLAKKNSYKLLKDVKLSSVSQEIKNSDSV